jgi:hypothetical protein
MTAMHDRILAAPIVLLLGGVPAFGSARAAEATGECVRVLAQLKILELPAPVYREGPGDARTYLADKDRPGEIARLKELANKSCSTINDERQQQEADARKLVVALSVRCVEYREELAALQQPGSRAPNQDIERHRDFVDRYCPDMSREDMWLPGRQIVRRRY